MRWPWERRPAKPAPQQIVREPRELRPTLPRPLVILISVIGAIGALILLSQVWSFVTPVFLALNLAIAVMPLHMWLLRVGAPPLVAALASLVTIYVLLIVLFWSLYWSLQSLVQELPGYSDQFNQLYQQAIDWLESLGISQDVALQQLQGAFSPSAIAGALTSLLSNATTVLGFLATLFVSIFFLCWDSMALPQRMARIASSNPQLVAGFDRFASGVQRYWVVTTLFGLIVSALDLVALMLLGVPLALVWAVFAFVTNYIPNIGFVIGAIPPTLMALLANGPVNALLTFGLFCVINFVMQSLVQPKVAGDAVGVTPATSFLSLLVWAFALGPVGALLALPATLAVKTTFVEPWPSMAWINTLMSSKVDTPRDGRLGRAVSPGVPLPSPESQPVR